MISGQCSWPLLLGDSALQPAQGTADIVQVSGLPVLHGQPGLDLVLDHAGLCAQFGQAKGTGRATERMEQSLQFGPVLLAAALGGALRERGIHFLEAGRQLAAKCLRQHGHPGLESIVGAHDSAWLHKARTCCASCIGSNGLATTPIAPSER